MSTIRGTWKNGHVELDHAVEWPEGYRVLVEPTAEQASLGMREEDWPTDPDGIADLLIRMDQIEPFLTPEEEAEWKAARQETKDYTIANMDKPVKGLFQ